jgi:ABC-type proline/glycine betaine transport system ATPase subunit
MARRRDEQPLPKERLRQDFERLLDAVDQLRDSPLKHNASGLLAVLGVRRIYTHDGAVVSAISLSDRLTLTSDGELYRYNTPLNLTEEPGPWWSVYKTEIGDLAARFSTLTQKELKSITAYQEQERLHRQEALTEFADRLMEEDNGTTGRTP